MISWSNPNPGQTGAQLTAGTQINQLSGMSSLVAAILENRQRQQAQQQQALAQMAHSVASAYAQSQAGGQADDAANAALYQHQYPGDNPSIAGFQDRVPDYGGTNALRAQQAVGQLGNQGLTGDLTRSKIDAENALAHNRWQYPPNSGSDNGNPAYAQQQERLAAQAAAGAAKENLANQMGVAVKDLPANISALEGYTPGKPDATTAATKSNTFPALGTHPAISDDSEGPYKDRVLSARDQYRAALDKLNSLSSGSGQSKGEGDLRSQAQRAIDGGASEEAVRARYKQLTGQDL